MSIELQAVESVVNKRSHINSTRIWERICGRQSCGLCFSIVEATREKLSNAQLRARNYCVCLKNLATLSKELNLRQRRWLELLKTMI
ncbi:hypothetical protein EPI10_028744 [Gossypium australe]|uniref:Uncharacterized protein n=1 Tax=Gossypium australe TaxID=47621 RepID=A0A5B6UZA1_9ROSI|nr:hypothetical protein EPI10_028744 [Gossypium australe]